MSDIIPISEVPTAEIPALVEQGLPVSEYVAEMERRKDMSLTPERVVKAALGIDWYDTESAARRVAEYAADEIERQSTTRAQAEARIAVLEGALRALLDLNDNCGLFGGEMYHDRIAQAIRALKENAP